MAANFWASTQRRNWQFTKKRLAEMRQELDAQDPAIVAMFPLPECRHLGIYFNQQLNRLGKRLGVRQQAIATAQVYLRRFYSQVPIRNTNPYMMLATALYLASKMEECPLHIRLVVGEARTLWLAEGGPCDVSHLGECEFHLISELRANLIVHHPYRTLVALQTGDLVAKISPASAATFLASAPAGPAATAAAAAATSPSTASPSASTTFPATSAAAAAAAAAAGLSGALTIAPDEIACAWSIVSDHYMTDLPLLYPPHVIALTAVLLTLVLRPSAPSPSASTATTPLSATSTTGTGGGGGGGPAPMLHIVQVLHQQQLARAASLQQHQQQQQQQGGTGGTSSSATTAAGDSPTSSTGSGNGGVNPPVVDKRIARVHRFMAWLAESGVDLEAMVDCTQEMISFYECHEGYNDKVTREQINRFVKARGLDK